MSPRISVYIPCYNYARFLPDAVESVLAQTLSDWEAIVIDDASTDNTAELIRGFRDTRIIPVFHQRNRGNIATFNEAVGMARGEFVVALSADDRYAPEFFQRTVSMLDATPRAAMVYTAMNEIDERGRIVRRPPRPHAEDGIHEEVPRLLSGCHIPMCAAVVRSAIHRELGLFTYSRAGDWDMWLRIALRYPIAYVNQPLYLYRRHDKNMSMARETLMALERETAEILSQTLSSPNMSASARRCGSAAWAAQHLNAANWRFLRGDLRGGMGKFWRAAAACPAAAFAPRRLAHAFKSIALGLRRRAGG